MSTDAARLPVVIVGAGPVGLAAAAHLLARGIEPLVLEAGDRVGASVARWAHVKMFSPWTYDVDRASRAGFTKVTGTWPGEEHPEPA